MIGTCWPVGERGLTTAAAGVALPRRDFGTYGVYVVWTPTVVGCRGGGRTGPGRAESGLFVTVGVEGGEVIARFDTEIVGDEVTDEEGE